MPNNSIILREREQSKYLYIKHYSKQNIGKAHTNMKIYFIFFKLKKHCYSLFPKPHPLKKSFFHGL